VRLAVRSKDRGAEKKAYHGTEPKVGRHKKNRRNVSQGRAAAKNRKKSAPPEGRRKADDQKENLNFSIQRTPRETAGRSPRAGRGETESYCKVPLRVIQQAPPPSHVAEEKTEGRNGHLIGERGEMGQLEGRARKAFSEGGKAPKKGQGRSQRIEGGKSPPYTQGREDASFRGGTVQQASRKSPDKRTTVRIDEGREMEELPGSIQGVCSSLNK